MFFSILETNAQQSIFIIRYPWLNKHIIKENKVSSVTVKTYADDTTDLIQIFSLKFDRKGRVIQEQVEAEEDLVRRIQYDNDGRITSSAIFRESTMISKDSINFNPANKSFVIYSFYQTWKREEFKHDSLGRILGFTVYSSNEANPVADFSKVKWVKGNTRFVKNNKEGNPEEISDNDYTARYTYDSRGRLSWKEIEIYSLGTKETESFLYRLDGLPERSASTDQSFNVLKTYTYEFYKNEK
ncbi:MAG: hypothetical protein V2A54_08310 [Bacteroidota bacterium]